MKSNIDGDGCLNRRCHKVVEVFEGWDDFGDMGCEWLNGGMWLI